MSLTRSTLILMKMFGLLLLHLIKRTCLVQKLRKTYLRGMLSSLCALKM